MVNEEVFYWQISWAGRWMMTSQRFTESAIRQEHPEAIRVDESKETWLTPETPQEWQQAATMARVVEPGVRYKMT